MNEMERLLIKMEEAQASLKATISEANGTTKNLNGAVKAAKERITTEIIAEVTRQVDELKADSAEEMRRSVSDVIRHIERDWRAKLGLDG